MDTLGCFWVVYRASSFARTTATSMLGYPFSTLSTELIDEIVDWVALFGTKGHLRNLLATDRAFGERCRVNLFKTLPLIVAQPGALEDSWNMIKWSPSITRYIRELQVQLQRIGSHSPVKGDIWSGAQPCFDNIIQALSDSPQPPTSLHLSGPIGISASFARWTASSFFTTTLTSLALKNVANFPLSAIRHLRNLRFLTLSWMEARAQEPVTPLQTKRASPLPELESLTYRIAHGAVLPLVEASHPDFQYVAFGKLRTLRSQTQSMADMTCLRFLINQSSSTLGELEIHHHHPYRPRTPPAFLPFQKELTMSLDRHIHPPLWNFGPSGTQKPSAIKNCSTDLRRG
jgi:hypothetical protein